MLLVTFSRDWADEFNCDGFRIFKTEEEWEAVKEAIEGSDSFYFGTNEGWDDVEDFIDSYTAKEITSTEYAAIARVIPEAATQNGYGIFPVVDDGSLFDEDED